jgi:hypothetical protein
VPGASSHGVGGSGSRENPGVGVKVTGPPSVASQVIVIVVFSPDAIIDGSAIVLIK